MVRAALYKREPMSAERRQRLRIGERVCDVHDSHVRHGVFNGWLSPPRGQVSIALVIDPETGRRFRVQSHNLAYYWPKG